MVRLSQHFLLNLCALLVLLGSFSGCGGNKEAAGEQTTTNVFMQLAGDANSDLRGLHIGDNVQQVEQAEKAQPQTREGDEYFYYSYPLDVGGSYSVTYSVDDVGLYEIQLVVNLDSKEQAAELFKRFKQRFEQQYKVPSRTETDLVSWVLPHTKFQEMEVILTNESEGEKGGKLAVGFYAFS